TRPGVAGRPARRLGHLALDAGDRAGAQGPAGGYRDGPGPRTPHRADLGRRHPRNGRHPRRPVRGADAARPDRPPAPRRPLPVPAGFAPVADDFARLVDAGTVAKFEVGPRSVVVYLRGLDAGQALELRYGLRATLPAHVTVPAARAYEYYDPDRQASSPPTR